MHSLLRFTSLSLLALALSANTNCDPQTDPDPTDDNKPDPSDDNGAPSTPSCDCDASIDKDVGDPLSPGGVGSYLINVGYYGSEHCDGGSLCIQDVLPAGLTFSSFSGSAWSCTSGDGITVDCCFTAALPSDPVSLVPIEIFVNVPADLAGEEIENCATIVQDDHSFVDADPTNNEACTSDEIGCGDLDEDLSTGFDNDAAVVLSPEDLDDDWQLIFDGSGGVVPRAPIVVNPFGGWLAAFPGSQYVAPTSNGAGSPDWSASGDHYTYERCFCLAETFSDPSLSLDVRADDAVLAVRLNGATLTPTAGTAGAFNDPQPLEYRDPDASLYKVGTNCVQIDVFDAHGVVTGLDVAGNIDAIDGACCELEQVVHDLSIRKDTDALVFDMGDLATYSINVTNQGTGPESGFTVVDPLNVNLLFVSNTNTAEWACTAAPAVPPQTVSCDYIGAPLAPGDSSGFELIVQLADPAVWMGEGPIRNCADVVGEAVDANPWDNSSCIETELACDDLDEDLSTGFDNTPATVAVLGSTDDDWQLVVDSSGDPVPSAPFVVDAYIGWLAPFGGSQWITNSYDGTTRATATAQGLYTYERCWCMSDYHSDPSLLLQVRGDNIISEVRLNGTPLVAVLGTGGAHNDPQPLEYEEFDPTLFLPGTNCVQVDLNNWSSVAGLNVGGSIEADNGTCCTLPVDDTLDAEMNDPDAP